MSRRRAARGVVAALAGAAALMTHGCTGSEPAPDTALEPVAAEDAGSEAGSRSAAAGDSERAVVCRENECVRVAWNDPGPRGVAFDGGTPFVPQAKQFLTRKPGDGKAVVRGLAVAFPRYQVPMRLVVSPRHGDDIRFTVSGPPYSKCDLDQLREVTRAAPTGTVDERVDLLIKARRLLDLCKAYRYEVPKLVRKYFEVSCSLAGDAGAFFAIHRDATDRFRQLDQSEADRKAFTDCHGRGVEQEIRSIWNLATDAYGGDDAALLAALTGELIAKADDPAWADGFEVARITADQVRALRIIDLKDRQDRAAHEGDLARALEFNGELRRLWRNPTYTGGFELARIDGNVIEADGNWFRTRRGT